MKRALVIGITGQDGAYLSALLLSKGYEVYGAAESVASHELWRLKELGTGKKIKLVKINLTDYGKLKSVISAIKPDEIYNLAGVSSIAASIDRPMDTVDISGMGLVRLLETARMAKKPIRIFQASSSEVLATTPIRLPMDESAADSPYRIAKSLAHQMARYYRSKYQLFVSCGILYNHESPLRLPSFVSRKISEGVARIKLGLQSTLELGQLDSARDWGYAPEFVEAMWLMLQKEVPHDAIIATGEAHTVREFVETAFKKVGTTIRWEGQGMNEVGRDAVHGQILVKIKPEYFRAAKEYQKGDISRTIKELGWKPRTSFQELVYIMVDADLKRLGG